MICQVTVIGGPYDGRIYRFEKNNYVLNKLIDSLKFEGQGFIECKVAYILCTKV